METSTNYGPVWTDTQESPAPTEAKERGYGLFESQTFGSDAPYQGATGHDHGPSYQPSYQNQAQTLAAQFGGTEEIPTTKSFIFKGVGRWLITAVLCVIYYVLVHVYEGRTLNPDSKSVFDWLTIGLTLILGLNMASSYKEMALHMRSWFYIKSGVNVREIELHSLMELVKLLWRTPSIKTKLLCAICVLLNIIVQAGVSLVSLTYSGNPAPDAVFLSPGKNITIPDMSRFTPSTKFESGELIGVQQRFAAHILGDIGSSYNYTMLPKDSLVGSPVAKYPSSYWNASDHWEYHYLDSAPSPGPADFNFLSVYSNRSVRSSAVCTNPIFTVSTNSSRPGLVTIDYTETGKQVDVNRIATEGEEISYYTKPLPEVFSTTEKITTDCGPGCSTVYAVEPKASFATPGTYENENSSFFYYECNITVLPTDANDPHTISMAHAALAAQAIALTGQATADFSRQGLRTEFVSYLFGVGFGQPQNNNPVTMADQLARFAIGVVAAAAQTNAKLTVQGNQPQQGVLLSIDLPVAFGVVLLLAALVQLVLLTTAVVLVSRLRKQEGARFEKQQGGTDYAG